MVLALILLLLAVSGGIAVTYIYEKKTLLIVRLAAGAVIGTALYGLTGFLLAMFGGLNPTTVILAAVVCALPLAVFRGEEYRRRWQQETAIFHRQWRDFFLDFNLSKAFAVAVYAGLTVLLFFFFERAMVTTAAGIGTGATQNLGDLPFHLLIINSFAEGQNFPPDNPIFSGSRFTYPFITDLAVAMMTVTGAQIRDAMLLQNMLLIIALVILLARFTFKLTGSTAAALIAPFLLLFNGGLGFLLFFGDAVASEAGVFAQILSLNNDYSLRGDSIWRWGNSLSVLFMTQRTMLLGIPLALIIFTKVWEIFSETKTEQSENTDISIKEADSVTELLHHPTVVATFIVGLLAGMLPLVHAHSFAVVMGMTGLLALLTWQQWRVWTVFFIAAAIIAVPEVLFAAAGSANSAQSFVGWKLGWDTEKDNFLWFWFVNTGLFIPILLSALGWLLSFVFREEAEGQIDDADGEPLTAARAQRLLLFYAPFVLCFIVPNLITLAPWVWDNIKVLIYWYLISIPFAAWLLAELWRRSQIGVYLVPVLFLTLVLAGWLDVWRTASGQVEHIVLPQQMVAVAAQVREKTPPRSLMMTAPEYATVPILTGRRWFLGYIGHVWSHGIVPYDREQIVKKIYAGGDEAKTLIQQNKIDYILVGPQERTFTTVNDSFFQDFPVIAEAEPYRVYQVNNGQSKSEK